MKENVFGYQVRRVAWFAGMFLLVAAVWAEVWMAVNFTGARTTTEPSLPVVVQFR